MKKFVAEQNIQHFKLLLASETDERQRALLQRMVEEEEAKLTAEKRQPMGDKTGA